MVSECRERLFLENLARENKLTKTQKDRLEQLRKEQTDAKICKAINPSGAKPPTDTIEKSSKERAKDAASKYCEYIAETGAYGYSAKDVKGCTKNKTDEIISCEDVYTTILKKTPEDAENICIESRAKINKPTDSMKETASDYCRHAIEEKANKKAPEEVAKCTKKTAQKLADCEDILTQASGTNGVKEVCTEKHAKILIPAQKEPLKNKKFSEKTPPQIRKLEPSYEEI